MKFRQTSAGVQAVVNLSLVPKINMYSGVRNVTKYSAVNVIFFCTKHSTHARAVQLNQALRRRVTNIQMAMGMGQGQVTMELVSIYQDWDT